MEDPYKILGLSAGATEQEIKAAYRRLARTHHPDSNPSEDSQQIFREITEAYGILSDERRRALFDATHGKKPKTKPQAHGTFGTVKDSGSESASRQTADAGGQSRLFQSGRKRAGSSTAVLKDLLGGFVKGTRSSKKKLDPRGERVYQFTIDALESIRGAERELALNEGETPRVIRVKIPPGVQPGQIVKVAVAELEEPLRIKILINPHPYLERDGADITVLVPVTLKEYLLGTETDVPVPGGSVRVRIPPESQKEKKLRLKGRGVLLAGNKEAGDLYVKTKLIVPDTLPEGAKAALEGFEYCYTSDVRADLPKKL